MNEDSGTALLDLLTNALAAVLLLMVIVAANFSTDSTERETEEFSEEKITTVELVPQRPQKSKNDSLISIQCYFTGNSKNDFEIILDDATAADSGIQIRRGLYDENKSDWSIIRTASQRNWQLKITGGTISTNDSVYVIITKGLRTLCSNDKKSKVSRNIFINVEEPVETEANISIFGQRLDLYNK